MIKKLINILTGKNKEVEDYQLEMTSSVIFKDNTKNEIHDHGCDNCEFTKICSYSTTSKNSKYHMCDCNIQCVKPYNDKLSTLLIIDDNQGVVSFLKDDILQLQDEGILSQDINVVQIFGSHAAFCLEMFLKKNKVKIDKAIIDITLGGSMNTVNGIVKYSGIDVYNMCIKTNPNLQYCFYTGNNLNPYIKANQRIMEQFKSKTGEDLKDKVLYKTSISMDDRLKYLANLFKG